MIKSFIKNWMSAKRSVKFWNIVVLAIYCYLMSINLNIILPTLLIFSIIAFIVIDMDDDDLTHFWVVLTPLVWVFLIMTGISYVGNWIYDEVIVKFNNWLNKEK